jgi:hypothetical protein
MIRAIPSVLILSLSASLSALSCKAQTADVPVIAVLKQLEHAEQTADYKNWIALWDRATQEKAAGRDMPMRPQPSLQYKPTKTVVQGDQAALIVEASGDRHISMRFVREDGAWKIADQVWSDQPQDPHSIYALVPPADGAFARAGSPWQNVPFAAPNPRYQQVFKVGALKWKLQAVRDESYIYVRIESEAPLPAANSEVTSEAAARIDTGVKIAWPVFKLRVTGKIPSEFSCNIGANIGDRSTFDDSGKANSHFHFVAYSMSLSQGDVHVFDASANGKLMLVSRNAIEARIPIKSVDADAAAKIEILDANGDPNGATGSIMPYLAEPFRH